MQPITYGLLFFFALVGAFIGCRLHASIQAAERRRRRRCEICGEPGCAALESWNRTSGEYRRIIVCPECQAEDHRHHERERKRQP